MKVKPIQECGVVVLGGTAGVGLETAAQFAAAGARVVVLGRDTGRGTAARRHCLGRVPGASVEFVAVDGTDAAAAVQADAEARDRLGAIDVLVNSTGPAQPPRLLHKVPIGDVRTVLDGSSCRRCT